MVVNIGNAAHYMWGQVCDGWRLADDEQLSVIAERMPPGAAEVRHFHQRARQMFYVLGGTLHIEVEGAVHTLARGDALEIKPGDRHRVSNESDQTTDFLVISAPATRNDRHNVDE